MKKILFIVLAVWCCGLQNVAAQKRVIFTTKMPKQVTAGESFTIELNINKGDISGAVRFIQSFPDNFIVEEIAGSNAGADFEWKPSNRQMYFRWKDLPAAPAAVDVAYRVVTPSNYKGKIQFVGQFIFTNEKNEVGREDMVSTPISIVEKTAKNTASPSAAKDTVKNIAATVKNKDTAARVDTLTAANVANTPVANVSAAKMPALQPAAGAKNTVAPASVPTTVASAKTPAAAENLAAGDTSDIADFDRDFDNFRSSENRANVFVVRQRPYLQGNIIYVNLQITKGDMDGYGYIVERTAPPAQIEVTESKGAIVDIRDGKIVFTWNNLPRANNNITLSYKIKLGALPEANAETGMTINGKFFFTYNDRMDSVEVVERDVDLSQELPVPDLAPVELSQMLRKSKTQVPPYSTGKNKSKNKGQRGLAFKIQVLAARNALSLIEVHEILKKRRIKIREEITEDFQRDGSEFPYKYVVGNFKSYEQACILRDYLQRNFGVDELGLPKAFLVCYYNGDRITVQEALLIERRK